MLKKFIKINLIVLIIFVILSNFSLATQISDTTDQGQPEEKTLDTLSNERNEIESNLNNANLEIEFVKNQLSEELYELEKLNLDILQKQQEIDIMQAEEEKLVDFINVANENNATNILSLLLDYKNKNFADFDPMTEFVLD